MENKFITLRQASKIANVSRSTALRWFDKYDGLAHMDESGRWCVDETQLYKIIIARRELKFRQPAEV